MLIEGFGSGPLTNGSPDPDPRGPKTYGSDGSAFRSGTLVYTTNFIVKKVRYPPLKKQPKQQCSGSMKFRNGSGSTYPYL
jgi:hypothetical protein